MAEVGFRGITKSFGSVRVLDNIDLDVGDGEFVSLLGPSGCGKTTLLRILAGLETQDAGEVRIAGTEVSDLPPKRRDVAMVFQSYALYPYMTVAENVALPLVMRRMSAAERLPLFGPLLPSARRKRAEAAGEVEALAESLGLGALLRRRPAQLSGGQRQRVALARAMVRRPAAFLMDEPLSNLDAKMRVKARVEISDLHRRLGATVIYVTHDQTEAMTMSDRVAVMLDGRILQVAAPQELYADPRHLRVAAFVGTPEINQLQAVRRSDGFVEVAGRTWPLRLELEAGARLTIAVRPEALALRTGSGRCELSGSVRRLEHLGADVLVHVEVAGADAPVVARIEPMQAHDLAVGSAADLSVASDGVLAFSAAGERLVVHPAAEPVSARPALREAVNG
jgi:multiple sugar transport system ATP-binding protein